MNQLTNPLPRLHRPLCIGLTDEVVIEVQSTDLDVLNVNASIHKRYYIAMNLSVVLYLIMINKLLEGRRDTHLVRMSLIVNVGEDIFPGRFILLSGLVEFSIHHLFVNIFIEFVQVLTEDRR